MRRNGAFTLIEILVAAAILAVGFIPVFTMCQNSFKKSALTDYHVFWFIRAKRIVQRFSLYEYVDLLDKAGLPADAAAGTPSVIDQAAIEATIETATLPPEYQRKLKDYTESLEVMVLEPGLLRLTATITWSFPLDNAPDRTVVLVTIVTDPTISLRDKGRENLLS